MKPIAAALAVLFLSGCGVQAAPAPTEPVTITAEATHAVGLDRTFDYMSDLENAVKRSTGFYCPGGWDEEDPGEMRARVTCGSSVLLILRFDLRDPSVSTAVDGWHMVLKMVGPYVFSDHNWAVVFGDEESARAFQAATGRRPLV